MVASRSHDPRPRAVSEFVALLVLVTAAIISTLIYTSFVSGFFGSMSPRSHYLRLSVPSVEVLHSGSPTTFYIGAVSFSANYVYRVTFVLHNSGTDTVSSLQYSVRTLNPSVVSVGTSAAHDVYDPIALASYHSQQLPDKVLPNQAVSFSLLILSKKDLTLQQNAVLVFAVRGSLASGEVQEAQVTLFG